MKWFNFYHDSPYATERASQQPLVVTVQEEKEHHGVKYYETKENHASKWKNKTIEDMI